MALVLYCILFFFSPVVSLLMLLFNLIVNKYRTMLFVSFMILASLALGIVNAGKIVESDLVNYKNWFNEVPNYSFYEYILHQGKEPLFFGLNYILYMLTLGNFGVYLISFTSLSYAIMAYSLIRVHTFFGAPSVALTCSMIVLFLFPNLFSLSAHLMRQFLAGAIITLFCVEFVFYRKRSFLLFLSAVLIHTTSLIFGAVYLLNLARRNRFFMYMAVAFVLALVLLLINYPIILNFISLDSDFLAYSLQRLDNLENSTVDLGRLSLLMYAIMVVVVLSFYTVINYGSKNDVSVLIGLFLLLALFVFISRDNSEVAVRFSFYFYSFLPMATYFLIASLPPAVVLKHRVAMVSVSFISLASYFGLKLVDGVWTYEGLDRLIFSGFWFATL